VQVCYFDDEWVCCGRGFLFGVGVDYLDVVNDVYL